MFEVILHYRSDRPIDFTLFEASYGGLAQAACDLIRSGSDVNARDEFGWTALMYASYAGHLEVVRILLRYGADARAGYLGCSCLYWAARNGYGSVAALLSRHWRTRLDGTASGRNGSPPEFIPSPVRQRNL